jgi:glycosyltransferase involved in cell wall biosynthesis
VVIFEAIAAGLPVVAATHNTSIPEMLAADEARFIEDRENASEYVAAFEAMLADVSGSRAQGQYLKRNLEALDVKRYASELLEVLCPERSNEQGVRRSGVTPLSA